MLEAKPRVLVERLYEVMNDREITDALRESGIDVTQATVNRIRHGKVKRTSYEIGAGLMRLHERFVQQKSA